MELGTHSGNSYFSFCQSVATNRLPTRCYAVDTWEGDAHAGFYDDSVFEDVDSYNNTHYHAFSSLLRMTFDQARANFRDSSVDLLHIDGLYTYDAVRHDFENWLPKMSPRGAVLFYAIKVHEHDFGVWKFWEEVSVKYPHIEFDHSHGLGILFVGNEQNSVIKALIRDFQDTSSQETRKSFFARIGHLVTIEYQTNSLARAVADHDEQIKKMINSSSWRMTKPVRKWANSVWKRSRKIHNLISGNWNKKKGKNGEYENWIERYDTLTEEKINNLRIRVSRMEQMPLISVLMPVYNSSPVFLEKAIQSVKDQLYPNWELCIADDNSTDTGIQLLIKKHANIEPRIKYTFRTHKGHISAASNTALELATGDYTAMLVQDDLLTPDALYWIANEIIHYPDAALIYSDEDKLNENGKRCDPYFKCDFNYSLLLSHNMICHLATYKTSLLRQVGGFRKGFEGAQNYDLVLRMIEIVHRSMIRHIPKVLYNWRVNEKSTALSQKIPYTQIAALKAINEHLQRMGIAATAEAATEAPGMNRVRYHLPINQPEVEIIILTRDKPALIQSCIESILKQTTYKNYSITIVDNGSEEPETHGLFSTWKQHHRITVLRDDTEFNFSRLNNKAVERSKAEFICMMNNDITIISPHWLEEMMGHALQAGVGVVGARLWYPNETLQHGGVILGLGGIAGHALRYIKKGDPGYCSRAILQQDFSAVTAACLLVQKAHYLSVGGFDETNLTVAYNDVDFCLKLGEKGLRNLWTPYAEMYHHESASRGLDNTPEKQNRFNREAEYIKKRWANIISHDPAYSPNLTLDHEDFSLAWPPRENSLINLK